jgi:hypothetical protein
MNTSYGNTSTPTMTRPTTKTTNFNSIQFNAVQLFIIYVPSQQPQGQLQTQHSVDTGNYIIEKYQHKVKDKLQASTGGKTQYAEK